ncbi:anti-sigma factor antagonist [Streptomyces sp. NPDC096339]|uniref:anti-sigma factor antagonist n=1 Tax=Streptomyces sp. NPDC096339 TaxID=3366086 RepID=UPI0038217D47
MDLSVSFEPVDDCTAVVDVGGEIDVYTAPALQRALNEVIDLGYHRLVVDLLDLDFTDSTGKIVLVTTLKRTREFGGGLVLVIVEPRRVREFTQVGLHKVMPIHTTVERAVETLQRQASEAEREQ